MGRGRAHSMKECRRFDTASRRGARPLTFHSWASSYPPHYGASSAQAPFGAFLTPAAAAHFCVIVRAAAKGIETS